MQTTAFDFDAIGTHWKIDIVDQLSSLKRTQIIDDILSFIEAFDRTYSRFREDSLVTAMARHKGIYPLPDNAKKLLALYKELYLLTDGTFTPLIGQVLVDAGYDAVYSLKPKKLQKPPQWKEVIDFGATTITMKKSALLDFGAGGKGYIIDLVGNLLKEQGIQSFCIDAGGDILFQNANRQSLRVGLEHPDDASQIIGIATIRNQSICASAANRRRWGKMHHIMNPHTLKSSDEVRATWVVAKTGLLADALATCLFFVSPEKLKMKYNFSYAVVAKDLSVTVSEDFPANIYMVSKRD